MQKSSAGYKVFRIFNVVFLSLLALLCVLPFLHILALSFSGTKFVEEGSVSFFPKGINLNAYRKMFATGSILSSFWVTVRRMLLGSAFSMLVTISAAYPLSFEKRLFPGRQFFVGFFFFSMMFSGGIIPYYMLIKDLGLIDSIWALVLGGVPISNMIILLNFFRTLPHEIFESARIDGASYWKVLLSIYIPLSLPSLATLTMLCLVGHWNDWFGGMVYMKSISNYPLQTFLYNALQNTGEFFVSNENDLFSAPRQAVVAAQTVFTILPTLVIFPLLQKYVKTGLVLGSVKG